MQDAQVGATQPTTHLKWTAGDDDHTDRVQEGRDRFAGRVGGLRGGAGMSLPLREQRALRGIEAGIWSSDPGLASWMAFFSRLTADEDMPGHERGPLAIVRICVMVWVAAAAAVCLVARAAGACLRAAAALVLWTGPCSSLDSRYSSPVAGAPWYSYRYHGPPRFHLSIMEPGFRSIP
jgi:hypothetical protein